MVNKTSTDGTVSAENDVEGLVNITANISWEDFTVQYEVTSPHLQSTPDNKSTMIIISDVINLYVLPVWVLIGLFLNLLVVFLMQRPQVRRSPISVYLTALACSDSAVLLMDTLHNWLKAIFNINIRSISDIGCRLFRFCFSSSSAFSSAIVCVIAIERVFAVVIPLKAKLYFNKKKSVLISVATIIVVFILVSCNLWMFGKVGQRCTYFGIYTYFGRYVYFWYFAVISFYLPFLTLLICNTVILVSLKRMTIKRNAMTNKADKDESGFTIIAVCICVAFVVFKFPNAIFYALMVYYEWFSTPTPGLILAETVINFIGTLNYSTNLLFYITASRRLRAELTHMIACCKLPGGASGTPPERAVGLGEGSGPRRDTPVWTSEPREASLTHEV